MATTKHLPLWTMAAPVAGWLLLGAASVLAHGLLPLALGAGLIACVLAAVHHAEVVAHRVGEPFGRLVRFGSASPVRNRSGLYTFASCRLRPSHANVRLRRVVLTVTSPRFAETYSSVPSGSSTVNLCSGIWRLCPSVH